MLLVADPPQKLECVRLAVSDRCISPAHNGMKMRSTGTLI